ncbi:hypothetical protein JCM1393_03240 [Clostridium carnis]
MKVFIKIILVILLVLVCGLFIKNKSFELIKKNNNIEEKKEETLISDNKIEDKSNKEREDIKEEEKKEDKEYLSLKPEEVKIPILMYHSIADGYPNNRLVVSVSQFTEEIKWLKEKEFTPMLLDEVIEAFKTGKVPKKPIAITFDDGYADNYTDAYRILKEYKMKGTFFIITNNTDADSYYMNSGMLKEMHSNGMGIENHTSIHRELNKMTREEKIKAIKDGINALREKVSVESKFLCYPVGRYDDETISVAKELGLHGAVTTEGGIATIKDGNYSLKRVRIAPMNIENFKAIFE